MHHPTRKSADSTRKKILLAAEKLFCATGYSGTTMQKIATLAGINTALLYHHFRNKKTLWQTVKTGFISLSAQTIPPIQPNSPLPTVLSYIINLRFELYSNNADLHRMLMWQSLESEQEELFANTPSSPRYWASLLHELQQRGGMRQDLNPDMVIAWINNSISGPSLIQQGILKFPQRKEQYKAMLLREFTLLLTPPN